MTKSDLNQVISRIEGLRTGRSQGMVSPHKFVFLLTLASLFNKKQGRENRFPLDLELEEQFKDLWCLHVPTVPYYSSAVEFPFFHLQSDGFWRLSLRQGNERLFDYYLEHKDARMTRKRLQETVEYGYLTGDMEQAFRDDTCRNALIEHLTYKLRHLFAAPAVTEPGYYDPVEFRLAGDREPNAFVFYLNSLHNCEAGNEHALAEYQARSPFFSQIHVAHPLIDWIEGILLRGGGEHVILTGHAGDGKTTIALDLCKRLRGEPPDQLLSVGLSPREDASSMVSIIKDLSEWGQREKQALLEEVLKGRRRFLLVSNTGTLLDFFREHAEATNRSSVRTESELLEAISDPNLTKGFSYAGVRFQVINLALLDNLDLARQIFARMLAPERWTVCSSQDCASKCPIRRNVELIQHHQEVVCSRLFMAYRRMYEYGTRLTLRQLTAHLAYMITSGLNYSDILKLGEGQDPPLYSEFMFFNRFFGDTGRVDDGAAAQLVGVREVRRQGFGLRLCPTWERRLWWKTHGEDFRLDVGECDSEFDRLRSCGAGERNDASGLTPDQAREQVRRMLFFLYDFNSAETSFLAHYLGSPMLLTWLQWQHPAARLAVDERNIYMQRVYHVLQEQFTGVRLPEGLGAVDRRLYITLSRRKREIRQSAQVVLAQIDWSTEMDLDLVRRPEVLGGERTDLELTGRRRAEGAVLRLALPFLDYVIMRHYGEMGAVLQTAYVERLERFKAELLERTREDRTDVLLVRLRMDNTFRRQQYSVRDNTLEVADV
jgi:hypothetical protein